MTSFHRNPLRNWCVGVAAGLHLFVAAPAFAAGTYHGMTKAGSTGIVDESDMDEVVFKHPVHVGDCVSFFTSTLKVGKTSIRVKVDVWAERRFGRGENAFVTEAEVVMVAVDDEGRKVVVGKK